MYPVQDQSQRITRHSLKTGVGLGFVTFVDKDLVEDIAVGSHDYLGHEVDITILGHDGDVVELDRLRTGDETGQMTWLRVSSHGRNLVTVSELFSEKTRWDRPR